MTWRRRLACALVAAVCAAAAAVAAVLALGDDLRRRITPPMGPTS